VADAYLSYLIDNDQYFRMMTRFMLDGSLSADMVEKLNASERRIFDSSTFCSDKMNLPNRSGLCPMHFLLRSTVC
jgi:hypothetical protein